PRRSSFTPPKTSILKRRPAALSPAFPRARFSADVQARLYKVQLETFGQRLDASGYSFAGSAAYRFDLPGNWTFEPSVGGIFSRTSVDHLFVADVTNSAGVPVAVLPTFGATALGAVSGTLQVNDV